MTFQNLIDSLKYDEETNRCYLSEEFIPENELAVFYMRYGFLLKHYETEVS